MIAFGIFLMLMGAFLWGLGWMQRELKTKELVLPERGPFAWMIRRSKHDNSRERAEMARLGRIATRIGSALLRIGGVVTLVGVVAEILS